MDGTFGAALSYEGTRKAIANVGIPLVRGGSQRPYFFDAAATDISVLAQKPLLFGPSLAAQPAGPQMGGHVTNYEDNLTFATVHGSGHTLGKRGDKGFPAMNFLNTWRETLGRNCGIM